MCRSIHRLREGTQISSAADVRAASIQFVRKVSGMQKPSPRHEEAFETAVAEISGSVERLLHEVVNRMDVPGR